VTWPLFFKDLYATSPLVINLIESQPDLDAPDRLKEKMSAVNRGFEEYVNKGRQVNQEQNGVAEYKVDKKTVYRFTQFPDTQALDEHATKDFLLFVAKTGKSPCTVHCMKALQRTSFFITSRELLLFLKENPSASHQEAQNFLIDTFIQLAGTATSRNPTSDQMKQLLSKDFFDQAKEIAHS